MAGLLHDGGLPDAKIVGAAPADIEAALDEAIAEAEILIVLGGDGTIRSAAEKLLGKATILVPLPGGTMNMLPKALYGARPWKTALTDTLANPEIHDISGGMVGDHAFFVAALFGAPTLWADAREAARGRPSARGGPEVGHRGEAQPFGTPGVRVRRAERVGRGRGGGLPADLQDARRA